MSSKVGTSTKVQGDVKYPGTWSFVKHILWHFRGSLLAALFAVFVMCSDYVLGAFLHFVRHNVTIQQFIRVSDAGQWLTSTFFEHRTDGKNLEDAVVFIMLTVLVHAVMYFGLNGFFLMCDTTGLLSKYKLPRSKRMSQPPLSRTIREAVINQFVTGPVTIFLLYVYIARFPSMFRSPVGAGDMVEPPTVMEAWKHMALASLCNEVLFYIAHRAFHEVPGMYARFHKQHHMYVGSIGFAAEYAHPLEQLLANQGPTAFYMLAFSSSIPQGLWYSWMIWRVWETYEAHSGYCFSGSWPSKIGLTFGDRAKFHDWHHSDNRGCYGVYWIDYLFGTMDSYAQLLADGGHAGRAAVAASKKETK